MNHIMRTFIFPGQGSQIVGMGRDFYQNFSCAKDVIDEAGDVLNFDLKHLMFDGPMEELTLTQNTQPALVCVSYAVISTLLKESGKTIDQLADFVAGHSLGEYAALAAAEVIPYRDAIALVRFRGEAMQSAVPKGVGAMAAIIGLEYDQISDALKAIDDVYVANDNSPGQVVISGKKEAVENACAFFKSNGAKRALVLPVSAPFHCPLMDPAAKKMKERLESVQFHTPKIPVITNVGAVAEKKADILKDNLIAQICGRVRWRESISWLFNHDVAEFVECGSGKVLTGLNKRIAPNANALSIQSPHDMEDFLRAMS